MVITAKNLNQLDFKKGHGLLPAIVQDESTGQVLMLGYMTQESLTATFDSGLVTFFSRAKQRLWTKGETSGNHLKFKGALVDCDKDTLLIKCVPSGPVCHLGTETCFNQKPSGFQFFRKLETLIKNRKMHPEDGSYTSKLLTGSIDKIAQKVGEEAVELVIEAKNQQDESLLNEAADLIYHLMVLLEARDTSFSAVLDILEKRHKN